MKDRSSTSKKKKKKLCFNLDKHINNQHINLNNGDKTQTSQNMLLKLNTKTKEKQKHIVRIQENKRTIQWHNFFMLQCMLGVMGEFCPVLVPSLHCSMKLLIVTIVEIHMLIIDVSL